MQWKVGDKAIVAQVPPSAGRKQGSTRITVGDVVEIQLIGNNTAGPERHAIIGDHFVMGVDDESHVCWIHAHMLKPLSAPVLEQVPWHKKRRALQL